MRKFRIRTARSLLRVASLLLKVANLTPPLGDKHGGPDLVRKRMIARGSAISIADRTNIDLALKAEKDPTPQQLYNLYPPINERGPEPFTKLVILSHAQYRMDLRGIPMTAVYKALENFVKQIKLWMNSRDPQIRIKLQNLYGEDYNWIDPATKLKIGLALSRRQEGLLDVKTVFYPGEQGKEPWRTSNPPPKPK